MTDEISGSGNGGDGRDPPTVFISYSHKDEDWKNLFRPHLGVLEQANRITIWDDRKIGAGKEWYDEIRDAMDAAAVAVCLISADFLSSKFCTNEEIPYLLERRERDGMILIPVLLRPCAWKVVSWLSEIQMIPQDGKSVARDFPEDWESVFAEVAERIFGILEDPAYKPPAPPPPDWAPLEKIDIGRLPATGAELFGRQNELALLDEAWEASDTNVVSLVAWGGVGKSTLVNKWLEQMAEDNYRGALRVFGWSFYSQGTGERVTSADQFVAEALKWFGDEDQTVRSPWVKGQRLADFVRQEPTLLILDGMEPLQSDLDYERGKINDPALATLVAELARENSGLCVISTREAVADLEPFRETTREESLEQISAEAGRALLRIGGVRGTDVELEAATRDFGNHAFALNLLAAYLHEVPGHHISGAAEIPDLDIPIEKGRHPRRVMAAFAERFGDGPEVELLRVLGLFDRPADADAVAAVRTAPPIAYLTTGLQQLPDSALLRFIYTTFGNRRRMSNSDWLNLLSKLRTAGLVAPESRHRPDTLDAHPLVREHFGQQLREEHSAAWREGNDRLYEHYKVAAPELPDTLEEMAPLFAAVAHGCAAGRHQKALVEVYLRRIQRANEAFNIKKLGAFGADLAALAGFFDPPWKRTVAGFIEDDQGYLLNAAGFGLRALARLTEAAEPMQAALESAIAQEHWVHASVAAGNLSEIHLTIGNLRQALDYAQQSVDLADESSDAFQKMGKRTTLADALHQAGQMERAEDLFLEAEAMQKERQPEFQFLYSMQGFQYCDLLLEQGRHQEVQERASQTLEWGEQSEASLLSIAVEHLSLGCAHLAEVQQKGTDDLSKAAEHLDRAVDGLRQAGTQHHIPRGLLARAALYRVQDEYEEAQRRVDEAMVIAERGGMGLHQADAHLEYARLYVAMGKKPKAREHWVKAKGMVEEMGYHRRDGAVAALEKQLEQS